MEETTVMDVRVVEAVPDYVEQVKSAVIAGVIGLFATVATTYLTAKIHERSLERRLNKKKFETITQPSEAEVQE